MNDGLDKTSSKALRAGPRCVGPLDANPLRTEGTEAVTMSKTCRALTNDVFLQGQKPRSRNIGIGKRMFENRIYGQGGGGPSTMRFRTVLPRQIFFEAKRDDSRSSGVFKIPFKGFHPARGIAWQVPLRTSDRLNVMELATNLKKLLKENDISAAQLSRATKIPIQTLSNWLSAQKPRDISQVKKVADYFTVTVDSLCFGNGSKPVLDDPIKKYDQEIHAGIFEIVLRPVKKK